MKSKNDMKEKLENMTTELSLYKEWVNEMETSDKKVIFLLFMYILYRFLLCDINIFIYGIIFGDMRYLERIWEIWNVYGRFGILYRFLLYDMDIFIYDIIFRGRGDLERIWEIWNVYGRFWMIYIITNLVLLNYF